MKVIVGLLVMLTGSLAFASSRIDLGPGSSVTVQAGDTTLVTCSGGGTSHTGSTHFCRCDSSGTLIRVDIVNGTQLETEVTEYSNRTECTSKAAQNPACL